jgi:cytochrome P450
MSETDVRDNILTFVMAGHETTALALTWTFYLLSLHRDVEARVRSEIAAVTGGARCHLHRKSSDRIRPASASAPSKHRIDMANSHPAKERGAATGAAYRATIWMRTAAAIGV